MVLLTSGSRVSGFIPQAPYLVSHPYFFLYDQEGVAKNNRKIKTTVMEKNKAMVDILHWLFD
jgi:hypothetical protein